MECGGTRGKEEKKEKTTVKYEKKGGREQNDEMVTCRSRKND